jgi:hypothetical protein
MSSVQLRHLSQYPNSPVRFGHSWQNPWVGTVKAMNSLLGPHDKVILCATLPATGSATEPRHNIVRLERARNGDLLTTAAKRETLLTAPDGVPKHILVKATIDPTTCRFTPQTTIHKAFPLHGESFNIDEVEGGRTTHPNQQGRDTVSITDPRLPIVLAPIFIYHAAVGNGKITTYDRSSASPPLTASTKDVKISTQVLGEFITDFQRNFNFRRR